MSSIEWLGAQEGQAAGKTWNPIRGCSRVSDGCRHCYAERIAARFSGPGQPYEGLTTSGGRWTGEVAFVAEKLGEPLRWRKPRKVFVNSMSDLFHEALTFEEIAAVFGVMAAAQQHTFQVLTKRPKRANAFFEWCAPTSSTTYALSASSSSATGRACTRPGAVRRREMSEKSITFSADMVCAILEGRKTQTRRVVQPQPPHISDVTRSRIVSLCGREWGWDCGGTTWDHVARCPYGAPGDRLYVREAYRLPACLDSVTPSHAGKRAVAAGWERPWAPIEYIADGRRDNWDDTHIWGDEAGRYRHARFMPQWASRLWLRVADIRVERLQDISEEDARAEGVDWSAPIHLEPPDEDPRVVGYPSSAASFALPNFRALWDSINAERGYGWEANPWVWAVEFRVLLDAWGAE